LPKQPWFGRTYNKDAFPHILKEIGNVTDVFDHRGHLAHRLDNSKMSKDDIRAFVRRKAGRDIDFKEMF